MDFLWLLPHFALHALLLPGLDVLVSPSVPRCLLPEPGYLSLIFEGWMLVLLACGFLKIVPLGT